MMRLFSLKSIRLVGSVLLVLLIGVMGVGGSPALDTVTDTDIVSGGDVIEQRATRTPRPSRTPQPSRTPTPTRTSTPDTRLPTFAFPVSSFGYLMRLSPDDSFAAVFNAPAFYPEAPTEETTAIHLLDTLLGDTLLSLTGASDFALDVVFTPAQTSIVSFHQNGDLIVWDAVSGEVVREFRTYYINNDSRLYMMNDGQRVIIFNRGVTAPSMIFNLETGAVEQFIGLHHDSLYALRTNSQTFANFDTETQFTAFVVSPDEEIIYAANANGDILRWRDGNLTVWREPDDKTAYERSFAIRRMLLNDDGSILIVSDEFSGEIRWFDTGSGRQIGSVAGIDVPSFDISPDGTQVVWVNRRQKAAYLAPLTANAASRLIATFDPLHQVTPTTRVEFLSDGSTVFIGGFGSQTGNNAIYSIDTSGI